MRVQFHDSNGAGEAISGRHEPLWQTIDSVLSTLPVHLKASEQDGLQGTPIFDPVGTNRAICEAMTQRGWAHNIRIPAEYRFLGTDVDYGKDGIIVEAQFSVYPYLLNNVLRSELFFKAGIPLTGEPTRAVVIITKAHMFPASQGTLYYEQALQQLASLTKFGVVDVPIRLVGLFEQLGSNIHAKWCEYKARYSRTLVNCTDCICRLDRDRVVSRCKVAITRAGTN